MQFFDDALLSGDGVSLKIIRTFPLSETNDIPSYLFAILRSDDGVKVGECTLRIKDDENIYYRGNVGFTVYREFRGHRYAARAVKLVLQQARKHGLPYLYITCEADNIASEKSILLAGGTFLEEKDVPAHTQVYQTGGRRKKIFRFDL